MLRFFQRNGNNCYLLLTTTLPKRLPNRDLKRKKIKPRLVHYKHKKVDAGQAVANRILSVSWPWSLSDMRINISEHDSVCAGRPLEGWPIKLKNEDINSLFKIVKSLFVNIHHGACPPQKQKLENEDSLSCHQTWADGKKTLLRSLAEHRHSSQG